MSLIQLLTNWRKNLASTVMTRFVFVEKLIEKLDILIESNSYYRLVCIASPRIFAMMELVVSHLIHNLRTWKMFLNPFIQMTLKFFYL